MPSSNPSPKDSIKPYVRSIAPKPSSDLGASFDKDAVEVYTPDDTTSTRTFFELKLQRSPLMSMNCYDDRGHKLYITHAS